MEAGTVVWTYSTPGRVDDDLPDRIKTDWHLEMQKIVRCRLAEIGEMTSDDGIIPFIDPTAEAGIPDAREPVPVPWPGFPAQVALTAPNPQQALIDAEHKGLTDLHPAAIDVVDESGASVDCRVRHRQDEYLEWEAEHDADGRLVAVTFVAEGYDYWSFLFEKDPERVAKAFRDSTGDPSITSADLKAPSNLFVVLDDGRQGRIVEKGKYNPRHQFNQGPGILHLSHDANSLGAELRLAIDSCLGREVMLDGKLVLLDGSNPKRLMCCSEGGEVNRSSDPIIGAAAYAAVTADEPSLFTLTDPVGLYIRSFNHEALRPPPGRDPISSQDVCDVQRGTGLPDNVGQNGDQSRILRLRVSAPEGAGYVLGEMTVGPVPLTSGAQLAQLVDMQLFVDIWPSPGPARRVACTGACCIGEDHILVPVEPTETCGPGLVDAFPELRPEQATPVPAAPKAIARGGRRVTDL